MKALLDFITNFSSLTKLNLCGSNRKVILIFITSCICSVRGHSPLVSQSNSGFHKVRVSNVRWYDEGASAKCANDTTYKFATLIENKNIGHANIFKGTDCAVEFTVMTRSDVDFAKITDVIVDVLEYKEAHNCITKVPAPADIIDVIYVKIKKPLNKKESFKATHYFSEGVLKSFSGWKVKRDNPESLMVRINAAQEGLYCILVKIKCRSYTENDEAAKEVLVADTTWWYFGR